jgi:hypothetical protein
LILNWNSFWQYRIDSLIIEVNGCLILDLCMIAKKILSLITWKLVWIKIHTVKYWPDIKILVFFYWNLKNSMLSFINIKKMTSIRTISKKHKKNCCHLSWMALNPDLMHAYILKISLSHIICALIPWRE